jgi:flagellar secretion chaperone FliS
MNYASESAAGVTPVGLVIRLYENIVADLGRAVYAVRDGDIEKRTAQLQHALLLIAHLQNALDLQTGGEPARQLDRFYSLARTCILEAQFRQSGKLLEELAQDFLSVREAWAEVEKQVAVTAQPAPSAKTGDSHSTWVA